MVQLSDKVRELIDGKNFAHIATIMKDGSPQVTTVWIDRDGDTILINTAEGRVKERNLKRDPRIAISITKGDNQYSGAWIRGKVVGMTAEGAVEHINKLAKKYTGADKYQGYTPNEKRIVLRIEAQHITERL
ncbi:MAG: PPOX class F420-dependent oxidoreductase [Candidatus Micrarchaeota archaeon]|nr:PPOX class F420-dependent oxidoreductase [Candidatus Micrarchaeota archaeon]